MRYGYALNGLKKEGTRGAILTLAGQAAGVADTVSRAYKGSKGSYIRRNKYQSCIQREWNYIQRE